MIVIIGAINEAADAAAAKSAANLTGRFLVFHFPLTSSVVGLGTMDEGVRTPGFLSDMMPTS